VLGLAAVVLLIGLGTHRLIQERIVIRTLDAQIETLRPEVARVQRIQSQAQALEKRINFIEGFFRRKDMNLDILQELTNILPTDTFLNIYRNQDCSIQIAGSSASAEALIPALERSALIANVMQRGTTYKDPNTGKDRFNFEAKCER
jgi:general secretion pathway protein L